MYYYFDYSQKIHSGYEDKELYYITDIIQQDPRTNELEKYIINYNIQIRRRFSLLIFCAV